MSQQPRTRKAHPKHTHIMGLPWTGNGHSYSRCTVQGCDYTVLDGVAVDGKGPAPAQAEQGRLFDVWGPDYVPAPGDKWQPR